MSRPWPAGDFSAVFEPGRPNRGGGERGRAAAPGPGGGPEYRGHPPGGGRALPFLIGWISDLWGLKWGVSLTLVALAAGAVLIFTALPHLARDLAAAGELEGQR